MAHGRHIANRYHGIKVTPLFDAEYLRNGMRYRHTVVTIKY